MPPSLRAVALLAVALVALVGCRLDVAIDVDVAEDGSGAVEVAVGLDDAALAVAGDLTQLLRTDDLVAAGWQVRGPERAGERTWVRATKGFAGPEEAGEVLGEVSGPDGALQDFVLQVDDGFLGTTYELTGRVDLTGGPGIFSDDELAAALDGQPFGGLLERVTEARGRLATELVDISLVVDLPGASPVRFEPTFADPEPTEVAVSSRAGGVLGQLWLLGLGAAGVVVVAVVALLGLALLRRGSRRPPAGRYAAGPRRPPGA